MKNIRYAVILWFLGSVVLSYAQVSSVHFGKNRVQYQTRHWQVIQNDKFDFHFYDTVRYFASVVAKMAYDELKNLEQQLDFTIHERFNIFFYISYEDYVASNVGIGLDWYDKKSLTHFVNNKILIYYSSSRRRLRAQIREGLIRMFMEYLLLGQQVGEEPQQDQIAKFPDWLMKGYISYQAEGWNGDLDYALRVRVMEQRYKKFQNFIANEPLFAGRTFAYFLERKYGAIKMKHFFNTLRFSPGLNTALQQQFKLKYRLFLKTIFPFFKEMYAEDEKKRKDMAKGMHLTTVVTPKPNPFKRQYEVRTMQANPATKKGIYARIDYKEGVSKVVVYETRTRRKTILRTGIYLFDNQIIDNYPQIAWAPNGTRLGVLYYNKNHMAFFEYDILSKTKKNIINFSRYFSAIHSFKYLFHSEQLLISAVRNGKSDIFIFNLRTLRLEYITNDNYDNIDPDYVTLGSKIGIVYASNRPVEQEDEDGYKQNDYFNIFIADYAQPNVPHDISPLTFFKYADARYPSQYNSRAITFISDENGIQNRYIAEVNSRKDGLDTFYFVGDKRYHNIALDSLQILLKRHRVARYDSVKFVVRTKEETKSYPITNYKNNIIESRYIAGKTPFLTDLKYTMYARQLYRVNIEDTKTMARQKLRIEPTSFRLFKEGLIRPEKKNSSDKIIKAFEPTDKDTIAYYKDYFLSEFLFNPLLQESSEVLSVDLTENTLKRVLDISGYKPKFRPYDRRFLLSMFDVNLDNQLLANQIYQPFGGGRGPITLNGQNQFLGMLKFSTNDLFEHLKMTIGYRLPLYFQNVGTDFIMTADYLKYLIDFGITYLRSSHYAEPQKRLISNFYLARMVYPIDVVRSFRLSVGARRDYFNYKLVPLSTDFHPIPDSVSWSSITKLEFIYDNTVNPVINIWKGLRINIFAELFFNLSRYNTIAKSSSSRLTFDQRTFNLGGDIRYYKELYKNIIFATRLSASFSFLERKIAYFAGGAEGEWRPKFYEGNIPDLSQSYAFQTLAVNLRGFNQNIANGSNYFIYNAEIRVPIITTIFRRPVKSAFLRNLMAVTFFDAGTAWNGFNFKTPAITYGNNNTIFSIQPTNWPFAMGYGWGIRSKVLGWYLKLDRGYPVGLSAGNFGVWYFSLGVDF